MENEEEIIEPSTDPPAAETPSSSLIVEQSDIDKVFAFPVFEQIENVDSNITDVLTELQKLNEYLIPTPEEIAEQEAMALQAETAETEALTLEEQQAAEAEALALEEEAAAEEEVIIDYDPLILEQLEILNAHMETSIEGQNDLKLIGSEASIMIVIALVAAIGVKVFIDQTTKW